MLELDAAGVRLAAPIRLQTGEAGVLGGVGVRAAASHQRTGWGTTTKLIYSAGKVKGTYEGVLRPGVITEDVFNFYFPFLKDNL